MLPHISNPKWNKLQFYTITSMCLLAETEEYSLNSKPLCVMAKFLMRSQRDKTATCISGSTSLHADLPLKTMAVISTVSSPQIVSP